MFLAAAVKNFYLTTAIDYANGSPHIGHAYEKVLADAIIRSRRMEGVNCHFLTGLDEHGQKVQETATQRGMAPQDLCDLVAQDFQKLCSRLSIAYDDYVRTTQLRHRTVVQSMLLRLHAAGEIYKAPYRGLYSTRAERFVLERERVDGKWPDDIGDVVELEEENYFFKLSRYQGWLVEFLQKNVNFIIPSFRQRQVVEFLKEPLNDLCISRPKARLRWGIELPFDAGYVTYVWFDALVNYISAVGYGREDFFRNWPADLHVIGKDILVPAHAVYWPIILHAAGVELPKQILAHGWWLAKGGEKMSKSLGNVVKPLDYIDLYGPDAFRYFVLREMAVGQDSNFSHELFTARYQGDLANDLGNLLSRLVHMVRCYADGRFPTAWPAGPEELQLQNRATETIRLVRAFYQSLEFSSALGEIFSLLQETNRYAERRAPWKLAKRASCERELETALASMGEALRIAAILLTPAIPTAAQEILRQLGLPAVSNWLDLAWSNALDGKVVGEGTILFPRVEEAGALSPL